MFPLTIGRLLVGTAILGLVGILATVMQVQNGTEAAMRLTPQSGVTVLGQPLTITLVVESSVPVNAFSGLISFDPAQLRVIGIDYNTSIADLWVEEPWYENGEGTITFAGGTTRPGGFTGEDTLIRVSFMPESEGDARLVLSRARVLEHNGFGTDAELAEPIDALFTVERLAIEARTVSETVSNSNIVVLNDKPNPDFNDDGKVGAADVSILMTHLMSSNLRYDLNADGKIGLGDVSILLDARD